MIEEICDQIYEPAKGIGVGHLIWCPVPHLEEVPRILEVDRAVSTAHYASTFEIVQMGRDHFKKKQKLPIKALALGETEELLISKAKKRPCVVVSDPNTAFTDAPLKDEIGQRRHLQDSSVAVAPIYGLATPEELSGFPSIMTARIRVLLYNQFFYLPKNCPKTKLSISKAGVVRLDRIFSTSYSRGMEPMDIKVSGEPLGFLRAMLRERFGSAPDDNLQTVREILYETLPPEARPKA